ncbi:MAG: T9SS type A sorting domain-containing protein [Saprospiraceae bacterium]|nr:T9SS type A sorting domain-containing protein [Saprospiraceae bacterium]
MKNFFTRMTTFTVLAALLLHVQSMSGASNHGKRFYVLKNPDVSFLDFVPWLSKDVAASGPLASCPGNIVQTATAGACGRVVNFDFGLTPLVPAPAPVTINQVSNPNVVNGTIYCSTGQTRYRRTFMNASPTDLNITSIPMGVYQASNNPVVTVNIYVGGNLVGSNAVTVTGTLSNTIYNFPITGIKVPAATAFDVEIVTPPPFVHIFKLGRNDQGHLAGFSNAVISSPTCTQAQLSVEGMVGGNAVVFGVVGTPDEYKITKMPYGFGYPDNNLNSGDVFPIGTSYMKYQVQDAYGTIVVTCSFTITVNPFPNIVSSIVCKGQVNVSLDEDCEVFLSAAQLLEGDNYGCFNNYIVEVTALNGVNLGNKVGRAQVGQKLKYKVTAPNGNSCWGEVLIEDKFGPEMICGDVFTTCEGPFTPGAKVPNRVTIPARILDGGELNAAQPNSKSYTIPVPSFQNATVQDLNVYINVDHQRVSDLAAVVTSPSGVTATLFITPGGSCNGQNLAVTMDDEALQSYAALLSTCEPTVPAISGNFKPLTALSIFDGQPLQGNWIVTIYDLAANNGGKINSIELKFTHSGANIPFPTPNNVTWTHVNDNIYVVNGIDNCFSATLRYDDTVIEENCASIYSKVVRRCWSGSDALGNAGPSCCQIIYIYRNSLTSLQFPPNYDDIQEPSLSCLDYGDKVPPTSVTGLPFGDLCYNVQILEPTDVRIDLCKRSYKLIRTHKIIEWCSGQVITHNQIIKVMDKDGPELDCPEDVTISTNDNSCNSTYVAPRPDVFNECSDVLKYTLAYKPISDEDELEYYYYYYYYHYCGKENIEEDPFVTTGVNQNTGVITGLPIGMSLIRWIVEDECGNRSCCLYKVTVEDQVKPIAVCHQFTKVSIGGNGFADAFAQTFNDGSHDNCAIRSLEVQRMDNGVPCGTIGGNLWGPSVRFCCEDIGKVIMVSMRVTDVYGNSNTCMVEVRVEDKLPPYITKCPPHITINCHADYKDLKITGQAEGIDNCKVESIKYQDNVNINQCGVGRVTRTWTIEDHMGFRNSCVQVITLIDTDPFKASDIKWPENYETKKCHASLDPNSLPAGFNRPTVGDDNCSLVAFTYKDQVFKFVDGACEKILRTWTVIDWCTYNENNPTLGQGWFEKVQIIKLNNDIAPIFETPCQDRTFQIFGECNGTVDFTMTGVDDCPEDNTNLVWRYELFTETGTTPLAVVNSNRFFRTMNPGTYRVRWTIEDRCGNQKVCTHLITVVDGKKPTPYCISSITTAVMNSNGRVEIWARDYDLGSFDNCTPKNQLIFTFEEAKPVASKINVRHYFKGNGENATEEEYLEGIAQVWIPETRTSGILFDCDDIIDGVSQEVLVRMTVTDLASNQDFCLVRLILQDNADVCPNQDLNTVLLSGRVTTPDHKPAKNVKVTLNSNAPEQNKTVLTNINGVYTFNTLPKHFNYKITAEYNGDIMAGISTLDLVFIQRHILQMEPLGGPYQIIAADVDNNEKVTASDIVALRKVILGITETFPNSQKSWRFVNSTVNFVNPSAPFPFLEEIYLQNLAGNRTNQNFMAVKIGDVNNSLTFANNEQGLENRSDKALTLESPLSKARVREDLRIPVYASDLTEIYGLQFTLKFDPALVEFKDLEAGTLNIQTQHYSGHKAQDGLVTLAWHQENPETLTTDEPLFYMVFEAKKSFDQRRILEVTSDITYAAAFEDLISFMPVRMETRTSGTKAESNNFALHQNQPNPFNDLTQIAFTLPESNYTTLRIFDVTGRQIYQMTGHYTKGDHSISIRKSEIGTSGVYYYKLESGKSTATRKMIIIE